MLTNLGEAEFGHGLVYTKGVQRVEMDGRMELEDEWKAKKGEVINLSWLGYKDSNLN
jgi:hypothetical protein